MGVAFAAGGDNDYYDGGPCTPSAGNTNWCGAGGHIRERRHNLEECQGCVTQKGNEKQTCTDQHANCLAYGFNTVQDCNTNLTNCNKAADNGYTACCIGFRCTC